jgi:hypothetical protein
MLDQSSDVHSRDHLAGLVRLEEGGTSLKIMEGLVGNLASLRLEKSVD